MNELERKLIEKIRESEEMKQIIRAFIFEDHPLPERMPAPFAFQETSS